MENTLVASFILASSAFSSWLFLIPAHVFSSPQNTVGVSIRQKFCKWVKLSICLISPLQRKTILLKNATLLPSHRRTEWPTELLFHVTVATLPLARRVLTSALPWFPQLAEMQWQLHRFSYFQGVLQGVGQAQMALFFPQVDSQPS